MERLSSGLPQFGSRVREFSLESSFRPCMEATSGLSRALCYPHSEGMLKEEVPVDLGKLFLF